MQGKKASRSPEMAPENAARVLRALRDAVEDSDLAYAVIEARAGFHRGYLSQLLTGHIELKVRHVFGVLAAIGRRRGAFFAAIFPVEATFVRSSPVFTQALRGGLDVVRVYSAGIDAVEGMRPRLQRCERAIERLLENEEVRRLLKAAAGDARDTGGGEPEPGTEPRTS